MGGGGRVVVGEGGGLKLNSAAKIFRSLKKNRRIQRGGWGGGVDGLGELTPLTSVSAHHFSCHKTETGCS